MWELSENGRHAMSEHESNSPCTARSGSACSGPCPLGYGRRGIEISEHVEQPVGAARARRAVLGAGQTMVVSGNGEGCNIRT